ncbi:MAG: hypothetical protein DSY66_02415 [Persephonella sp.]|nr:MAG: hypothetical protein DSY66_02415 [Persephonella sp.]
MFDKIGKSKFSKFVLIITTFAFVGTGLVAIILYKLFYGVSGAIEINGESITFAEINFRASQLKAKLEAQGVDTTTSRRLDKDILKMAVLQAINDELLYQEAEREGITATKKEVEKYILDMDIFKENGKFSQERYIQFLQNYGISSQVFEELIRKKVSISHLFSYIDLGMYITDEEVKALSFIRNVLLTGKALVINVGNGINVSEKELKNYYEKNKDKYKVKEGKKIVIFKVDVEKLGKDEANRKAKEIYTALKNNQEIKDKSVEVYFKGIYKEKSLSEKLNKELAKLGKDKNIFFLKTDKEIFIGKYLGEGYSYKKFDEIKDSLKEELILNKKKSIAEKIYKDLSNEIKTKSLEDIASKYSENIADFKDKGITYFINQFGINPINLEKIVSKGKHILNLGDRIVILDITAVKLGELKGISMAKMFVNGLKQQAIIQMYIDKLKENADIKINPILKEKLN